MQFKRFIMRISQGSLALPAIVVLLLLAIGGPAASVYRRHRLQCCAVREIQRLGGDFEFVQSGPSWLRTIVGGEPLNVLDELTFIWLADRPVNDADFVWISGAVSVQTLGLPRTNVTDAGLAHLSKMKKLTLLELGGTQITDAGLAELKVLPRLRILSLRATQVSDAGICELGTTTSLAVLDVEGTNVTDGGVAALKRELPNLAVNR